MSGFGPISSAPIASIGATTGTPSGGGGNPTGASGAPPTRQISWLQMVQEADPHWRRAMLQPVQYEFSNGRRFIAPINPYA